jgi:hypothetical protein
MKRIELKITGEREIHQSSDGKLSFRIPMQMRRRNGRKLIRSPSGETIGTPWDKEPTVLQTALARGYRWMRMFESGQVGSIKEIGEIEGIDPSYVSRMINLTVLAPWVIEAILDDKMPDDVTLFELAVDPMVLWSDQKLVNSI